MFKLKTPWIWSLENWQCSLKSQEVNMTKKCVVSGYTYDWNYFKSALFLFYSFERWKQKERGGKPWKPIKPQQGCPLSIPWISPPDASWDRQCIEEQMCQAAWHMHPNINFQETVCPSAPGRKSPSLFSYFVNFSNLEGSQLVEVLCSLTVSWEKYSCDMDPCSTSIAQVHVPAFTESIPDPRGFRALSRRVEQEDLLQRSSVRHCFLFFDVSAHEKQQQGEVYSCNSAINNWSYVVTKWYWVNQYHFSYFFSIQSGCLLPGTFS